ncbi:hypothetical protein D3C72_1252350 [compost metagenome]
MAIGEADAGGRRQLQQGAEMPAKGPAIPLEVLGNLVVGGEGAAHFPFPLDGGKPGADRPVPVDAIGQGGTEIHGLDIGDVAKVTGVVVVRHLDAEAVIGGGRQPQPPLFIQRKDEIGIGDPGTVCDVAGACIQRHRAHGGRHPGHPLDVDVRLDVNDAPGEGGALEAGHGRGVTGEHAGIVGDGGFTGEGAAHAGGRLFRQLETGRLGLTR